MRCMLCGTENREGAVRCKQCSHVLDSQSKEHLGKSKTPEPTVLENDASNPVDYQQAKRKTDVLPDSGGVPIPPGGKKRRTVFIPPKDLPFQSGHTAKARIAGFLVTFSWDSGGQSAAFRDGKTIVGSAQGCDLCISQDTAMSGQHFAIMVRAGHVKVRDLDSTNATEADGCEIWGDAADLRHGSIIKAGGTTFVVVLIPSAGEN